MLVHASWWRHPHDQYLFILPILGVTKDSDSGRQLTSRDRVGGCKFIDMGVSNNFFLLERSLLKIDKKVYILAQLDMKHASLLCRVPVIQRILPPLVGLELNLAPRLQIRWIARSCSLLHYAPCPLLLELTLLVGQSVWISGRIISPSVTHLVGCHYTLTHPLEACSCIVHFIYYS